jgi:Reversibly glycosylated polypeptide
MKVAVVTTTIHVPELLRCYAEDARQFGRSDVSFIVVGDRKTPAATRDFCEGLRRSSQAQVVYLDLEDQAAYLTRYPELKRHLPYDSIQRRNVGMLLAYEGGAEVIITIDDDNFLAEPDFVGRHQIVGSERTLEAFGTPLGWINVCEFLREEHGGHFYHRGFPLRMRGRPETRQPIATVATGRVVVNAGLWLDEPDVDAVTRLAAPVRTTGFRGGNFALAPGSWSPFNSQNTALHRDVIPAYFLSPLVGRYDDIWASYVVCAIATHLGDLITFGHPLVRQTRNPHDYWVDLEMEANGMRLTDRFTDYLRAVNFRGRTYGECFEEAAASLGSVLAHDAGLSSSENAYLQGFLDGMQVWSATIARVESSSAVDRAPLTLGAGGAPAPQLSYGGIR